MSENNAIKSTVPLVVKTDLEIRNMIHVVRGQQIILDSDLALLYEVETKRLNERVKRNSNRFPENFCFQLTRKEFDDLRSQFATSSEYGGRRYLPYAFTEQGIAMLSAVLNSDTAVEVSIRIMNSFVAMRRFIASNGLMFEHLNAIELRQIEYQKKTDERFDEVFEYISGHSEPEQKIFFEGQIYDAFELLTSLVKKAKKEIVLVDGYVDLGTLNILAKKQKGVKADLYTFKNTKLTKGDIDKFNAQYPDLTLKYMNIFHDRFIILDKKEGYLIGASLKDAGKKCFGVTKLQDSDTIKGILERLKK